jgi:hypothetical protein
VRVSARRHRPLRSKEAGPFIVIYRAVEKQWPTVGEKEAFLGKKLSYDRGEFAGWMMVVNLQSAKIQCAGKLEFTNGDNITYDKHGLRSAKDAALKAALDDLKSQFEEATTKEIAALTERGARLGYKLIE